MSATIALVHVEAGLGPLVIARRLQAELASSGHCSSVISLRELIPAWLHNRLLDRYRSDCQRQQDNLSLWFRQPWRFRLLYRLLGVLHWPTPKARQALSQVSVAVATSYLAAFFLLHLRSRLGLRYRVVGVLGDYCTSPGWRIEVDALITAQRLNNATLDWLGARNVPLLPLGIPLEHTPATPRPSPGHLLVCGGGWGLGSAYDCLEPALAHPAVTRVTALCGDNPGLLETLAQRHAQAVQSGRLQLHTTQSGLTPLYAQAWAIITKPGGLTLSEAAQNGCPLLLAPPITEHERCNAAHFLDNDAALDVTSPEQLNQALDSLPSRGVHLSRNARALIATNATQTISTYLLSMEKRSDVDH
ncbi:hypothetical protein RTH46_04360 [Pseudomonas sp. zfem004]|uniref:hypothetical protein n=1 Tax=Pseudomonas sp. zfem004 TaxID=3078199 RepID=UPI0029285677|nr:hypothetical protein [Pseudomonas sp. zfem004]MDU9401729.1 hypothetical protein [Pseudomonas sp. zfem004]